MVKLMCETLTLEQYRRLLEAKLGWIAPLERQLVVEFGALPFFRFEPAPYRRRTPRLLADLRTLGHSAASLKRIQLSEEVPDSSGVSRVVGVLYVIEGSSLGGALITRTLRRHLGETIERSVSYFDCYDGQAGRNWSNFRSFVEGLQDFDLNAAIQTANSCFSGLNSWLAAQWEDTSVTSARSSSLSDLSARSEERRGRGQIHRLSKMAAPA